MEQRIGIVNKVIEQIAKCGRHFFLNQSGNGMLGRFVLQNKKLYYIDEWKGVSGVVKRDMHWGNLDWVNHGGGLKEQIMIFAEFIFSGKKQQLISMYWGYPFEDLKIIHQFAFEIGFCESNGFWRVNYDTNRREYFPEKLEMIDNE
jgi:hypothetical protein